MLNEIRWLLGFNVILSIWIGMLANAWKGRNSYGWFAIGLCISVFGLGLLAALPKLANAVGNKARSS
jgi:hypothetical protein